MIEEFDQPFFKIVSLSQLKEKQEQIKKEQKEAVKKSETEEVFSLNDPTLLEFYNKCHDEDGRFCEGEGGDLGSARSKKPVSGKTVVREYDKTGSITDRTKRLGLPDGEYVLAGSAWWDVLGIRKSDDMDLVVTPKLYKSLQKDGKWKETQFNFGKGIVWQGNDDATAITLPATTTGGITPDIMGWIKNARKVDGVPLAPISELFRLKRAYNRPKDQVDIKAVTKKLGKDVEAGLDRFLRNRDNKVAADVNEIIHLTLIEGEGVHYHYDPETQFYNQCHSPEDGRFCSAPGAGKGPVKGAAEVRDSDGKAAKADVPKERGPHGGSLVDPSEGTNTFDGLKGYDKKTGKAVPGTDAWLEAHGLSREIFESRPYVKFEADKNDPALHEAFERGTPGAKQWDRLAGQEGQDGGYIMYKHPIPDSPYGPIAPQVRPNEGAITNYAKRAQKQKRLEQAKQRYEDLKTKITPQQLMDEQKAKVKKAETNLERIKTATPEKIRAEAKEGLDIAKANYEKAKATKDPDLIQQAKKDKAAAQREVTKSEYTASKFKPESAVYHAQKEVDSAKQRLSEIQDDPKGFLAAEIIRQGGIDGKGGRIKRAENAYKDTKAKYLFTTGEKGSTARIDMNPDKQNVKNLMEGKGRIYFAMEGSIKNDAVLAAVKREDPTAAVVNVPSVTLWHNKSANEGEITWFARTHAKDRQVILIPDADGVNNPNVERQAKALGAALKTGGAKEVIVAAPPVKHGTKSIIDPVQLPSGTFDERKGIDDHLGAGRGTLGQLAYKTEAKIPKFSLSHLTRGEGNEGEKKLNRNALKNHENMLGAISALAGKNGAVQVSKNLLMQTSGITSPGSAIAARDKLQELGIIDVRHVFDKDVLWQSRKRVLVMPQKEVDSWVSKKIIKPLPEDLFAKDDYEASPIIVIKDPKYIVKEENTAHGVLSDLPGWKTPRSYDGWRSPLTGRKDTTGQAERLVTEENKTKAKNAGSGASVSVAKTAEQRAALKKAPPGRKLVRTEAGAKKYGVPIGSVIPLSVDMITSMVLLSSVVAEEEMEEFYNMCHGEDGRFCEGEDGPGRARDKSVKGDTTLPGKPMSDPLLRGEKPLKTGGVRQIAKAKVGSVEVDGIKAKAVYELVNRKGGTHRLYDKTGEAEPYANEMLWSHARMAELYPLEPPRGIVVAKPKSLFNNSLVDKDSFATVYGDNPNTYVNSELLGIDVGKLRDGYQMPSAKTGNTKNMDYLLKHEYGHHLDFSRHSDDGYDYEVHPLFKNPSFRKYLSDYGNSDRHGIEGYSEAFAEWHHSAGTTKNPAAIAMAKYEGWKGANPPGAFSQSTEYGELISLTLQNSIHLQKDEVTMYPEDTEDDINADIPKVKGIRVIDVLDEGGAVLEGDFKTKEPSTEKIKKANDIMAEVLKELGLEG